MSIVAAPICPNCARPMVIARTLLHEISKPEINVYACARCRLSFTTEDHLQVSGPPAVP
jgi:hypothetical protein